MTKRPSVFGELNVPEQSTPAAAAPARPDAAKVARSGTPAKGEGDMFRTSLYLSHAVHDKLREISFHEKKKVHELFMEGIDAVLAKRGYASSAELKKDAKA